MKFILLEKFNFKDLSTLINTEISETLEDYLEKNIFNKINTFFKVEKDKIPKLTLGETNKEEKSTQILVRIDKEQYKDRNESSKEIFERLPKDFSKIFQNKIEKIINSYQKKNKLDPIFLKEFELVPEEIFEKPSHTTKCVIKFTCSWEIGNEEETFWRVKNKTIKKIFFKPNKKMAVSQTKVFEYTPLLIATEVFTVEDGTFKFNPENMNKIKFLSSSDLSDMKKVFRSHNIVKEKDDKSEFVKLYHQGISIKDNIISKLKVNYFICSDKDPLGHEIKKTGKDLIFSSYGIKIHPDKFSNFDIIFVNDKEYHKRFKNVKVKNLDLDILINFKLSFCDDVKNFGKEVQVDDKRIHQNFLGLSMKVSEKGSQAGKIATYYKNIIKSFPSIEEKFLEFKNEREFRYDLFSNLLLKINSNMRKVLREEGLKVKILNLDVHKEVDKFWIDKKIMDGLTDKNLSDKYRGYNLTSSKNYNEEQWKKLSKIQETKYKSLLYLYSLLSDRPEKNNEFFLTTTIEESITQMINTALATLDQFNPSYFKSMGEKIEIFKIDALDLKLDREEDILIKFPVRSRTSENIILIIPVLINLISLDSKTGGKKLEIKKAAVQFRCSGNGINPELQSFISKLDFPEQIEMDENLKTLSFQKISEILKKLEEYK